ncbi:GTP-binding and nucleic acid-binding protein YchF [Desulfurella amilsii]|uniref:Ribosome-binding ATPase YchF n=1 Tax=Desulfurella amilsii TaxID=1562698 RepID=A0A1X4XZV1_9BACT|nr:redox-regulated ATPase YchF [Desulfurella amilsii]OSS43079.1 GTP-binding and nucleic acid-binding protein YchF [Desulfurella amilsii]
MSLECGIIGLPNVGKSTTFNALSKANAKSSNFPFCTIEPNVGIALVKDKRIDILANIVKPANIVYPTVKFVDIAGLVKGASKGEGLGNQFLSHIRDVNVIVHLVRCFENEDIIHVEGSIDPKRDIDIINTEIILSDLQIVENKLSKAKKANKQEAVILEEIKSKLEKGEKLYDLTKDQESLIKELKLISAKKMIYVSNVDEKSINGNKYTKIVAQIASQEKAPFMIISSKIEEDLVQMEDAEKKEYLEMLGLNESGLEKLSKLAYELLDLISFFTAGPKEVRGWPIEKGTVAKKAAKEIHSDIERGFIRAEVISFDDYVKSGGEKRAKEMGLVRLEGKDYMIQDGDIVYFRFNV